MSTLRKVDFLAALNGRSVRTDTDTPNISSAALAACDVDGDGEIKTTVELERLFAALDKLDNDGNRLTLRLGNPDAPTRAAEAYTALLGAATHTGQLRDVALSAAFSVNARLPVRSGARGPQVVAVQYALGRLGLITSPIDGAFGRRTEAALKAFQANNGLAETGAVDSSTLQALDRAVSQTSLSVPAAAYAEPLDYLTDFSRFPLSPIEVVDRTRPLDFSHPEIQGAYGRFCEEYWPVMKDNRIECDCKTVGLFLLRQFRKKAAEDLGVTIPMPSRNGAKLADTSWTSATAARSAGYFSRTASLPVLRPGYSAAVAIQNLDPTHSMLYGVNIRQNGLNADAVSRVVDRAILGTNNGGDLTKPEVDIERLRLGDTIFMDHKGDGKFDHAMTVVGIERDPAGHVGSVKLAIGSFDDMKDANSDTPPAGANEINQYAEELVIYFNQNGRITGSETTWTSEPAYVQSPRYSPRNTMMELRGGGVMFVGRWNNT